MAERRSGPREGPEACEVSGCKEDAERSVASKKFQGALPGLGLKAPPGRRVNVCRRHYRDFKKATKQERTFERLDW